MDAQQIETQELRQVRRLDVAIGLLLNCPGSHELVLKTKNFSTQEVTGFDDYAISIEKAKLDLRGYSYEEKLEFEAKDLKTVLTIDVPLIALKAKAERLGE